MIVDYVKGLILELFAEKGVGKILSCQYHRNKRDSELLVFSLVYSFEYQGKTYPGNDEFMINADHVEYAHAGFLYTVPKLPFTMQDVKKVLQKGAPITVHFVPMMPWIHGPEYDPIVYQASRL